MAKQLLLYPMLVLMSTFDMRWISGWIDGIQTLIPNNERLAMMKLTVKI